MKTSVGYMVLAVIESVITLKICQIFMRLVAIIMLQIWSKPDKMRESVVGIVLQNLYGKLFYIDKC